MKRNNDDELVSLAPHPNAVVRPKERAAAILAQVDREMARIKERDHHWEDGIDSEVCCLHAITLFSLIFHLLVECISAPACHPSPTTLQMGPPTGSEIRHA